MKEPIEELFKQSLKGHEMPYNPNAWKAMNARLDAVSPVVTPTSYLKYYIGAAVVGVAAITTYVVLSSGNTIENNSIPVAKEITTKKTSTFKNKLDTGKHETQPSNTSVISKPKETPTLLDKGFQNDVTPGTYGDINADNAVVATDRSSDKFIANNGNGSSNSSNSPSDVPEPVLLENTAGFNPSLRMKMPEMVDICLNEKSTITNTNEKEIYILDGLNQIIKTIPANKTVVFAPTKVGSYSLGYTVDSRIASVSNFQVNRIPDADFMIDVVNKFENGLPSTHVEAISGQGTYIWKAEKQSTNGLKADMHFYSKGDQTIELTVNNGQCSATIEKSIFIEDDYKLLAVNSFTPTSTDSRVNTFMPFALTQRDVNFVLTIIDGRDGGIVYETADASLPWDGTDIRIGRRNPSPQVYVWKVVISNPALNEPSEYLGTILMN